MYGSIWNGYASGLQFLACLGLNVITFSYLTVQTLPSVIRYYASLVQSSAFASLSVRAIASQATARPTCWALSDGPI